MSFIVPMMVAVAALLLGARVHPVCYLGLVGVPVAGIVVFVQQRNRAIVEERERLRASWGVGDPRERDFARLRKAYGLCGGDDGLPLSLDDHTWTDLNMDSVYAKLDRTLSTPGEEVLYSVLRQLEKGPGVLEERDRVIRLFQSNPAARETVQQHLLQLGKDTRADITAMMYGPTLPAPAYQFLFAPLAMLAAVSCLTPFVAGMHGVVFAMLPVFVLNCFITHCLLRRRVMIQIHAVRYLCALVRCAERLSAITEPALESRAVRLAELVRRTRTIAAKGWKLGPDRLLSFDIADLLGLLYEYASAYFLVEVRTFHSLLDEVRRKKSDLQAIFRLVGEVDALQAVASFREGLPCWVVPEFGANGLSLELEDGRHPLLTDPAPNTIRLTSRCAFITGSNMSGKSTFLRTVALNAILAQTVYTCCASSYRGGFFRVISSMNHVDAIEEGKSYYLTEAERLLRIVRAVEDSVPSLCVIDELLRGTNSTERVAASTEILDFVCRKNAIVIVVSHDLDLAHTVEGTYDAYHFADHLAGDELRFDYLLHPGISDSRNAIELLHSLGYPEAIVEGAKKRAEPSTGT